MELGIKKLNAGSIVFGLIALAVIGFITADIVIKFQGLYLILFSFAYVLFPGFMLLVSLGQDFLSRYKKWLFLFSFYAGFALLVIEYFLLNLIGFLPAIKVLPVLLGIGLAALSWKRIRAFNYKKIISYDLKKAVPYLFLLAAVMAFSYYYLLKTAPSVNSNLFMDFCYHMGNVETLTRGGSFEDIRVMGMTFKYHYFMEHRFRFLHRTEDIAADHVLADLRARREMPFLFAVERRDGRASVDAVAVKTVKLAERTLDTVEHRFDHARTELRGKRHARQIYGSAGSDARRILIDLYRRHVAPQLYDLADQAVSAHAYNIVHMDVRHAGRGYKRTGYLDDSACFFRIFHCTSLSYLLYKVAADGFFYVCGYAFL